MSLAYITLILLTRDYENPAKRHVNEDLFGACCDQLHEGEDEPVLATVRAFLDVYFAKRGHYTVRQNDLGLTSFGLELPGGFMFGLEGQRESIADLEHQLIDWQIPFDREMVTEIQTDNEFVQYRPATASRGEICHVTVPTCEDDYYIRCGQLYEILQDKSLSVEARIQQVELMLAKAMPHPVTLLSLLEE
jgi:hypothetical protein